MVIIYDFIYLVFFILYTPVLFIKKKWHNGYRGRFGIIGKEKIEKLRSKENIWFHAVSVGEVLAVVDLINKVRAKFPNHRIVVTTVTKTGYQLANQKFPKEDVILFAPLDMSFIVKKMIRVIHPIVYVAAETEIWPNLYRYLEKGNVPMIQINGRISDKSFKGYKRISWLIKKTLKRVSIFCMQSDRDANRIIALGADEHRVSVTGNIKFDNITQAGDIKRKTLGFEESDKIIMAGSTHANEEELLLSAYESLCLKHNGLRFILAPRHIERAGELKELIARYGYKAVLLSEINSRRLAQKDILLVDRIGVLKDLYSIATVVFIGKTLAAGGGQNMIEPASFGKPTVVGPLTYNFKDVVRIFLSEDALVQIREAKELEGALGKLLNDEARAKKIGERARAVVEKYQGASARTLEYISTFIER